MLAPPGGGVPAAPPRVRLGSATAALRIPGFRRFWLGAICASTATWMLNLTVPLLLYQATGSALWAGLAAFSQFVPAMLGSPIGGVLADRYPRRTILFATQAVALGVAVLLAVLTTVGVTPTVLLLALVAVAGTANGVQTPAWQAMLPQLVPTAQLLNAVALNAMQANLARALGPVLATLVLSLSGPAATFVVAAGANIAMVVALATVRPATASQAPGGGTMRHRLASGLRYTRARSGLLVAIALAGLVSFVGTPVVQLAAVFAADVYRSGEVGVGLLASALGAGAVLGTVLLGRYGGRYRRSTLALIGVAAHGVAALALAAAPVLLLGVAAVLALGVSYLVVLSTANVAVQLLTADAYRGRVASLYWMAFAGGYPIGALVQGWLADLVGVRVAVAIAGGALLLVVAGLHRSRVLGALDGDNRGRSAQDQPQWTMLGER